MKLLALLAFFVVAWALASTYNTPAVGSSGSYVQDARDAAQQAGIDPELFVRQIREESGFNPHSLSPAGAEGIAQFMPQTAAGLGIDPWNPVQALQGAAQMMRRLLDRYGGSWVMALATYNAGSGRVAWAREHCANFFSCLPPQTRHYISIILQWT